MSLSKASSDMVAEGPKCGLVAALHTRMSMRPKAATLASTRPRSSSLRPTWQARAILRRLAGLSFSGMDVVEVSPPYDVAEITALAAATIAWDYIGLLAPR